MPKNGSLLLVTIFSLLLLSACDKGPKDGQVATVNGDAITAKEYTNILAARFGTAVARNDTERDQVINYLVKRKLLVHEAEQQKLDDDENVALAIKLSREELLIRAVTAKYIQDNPVTDQDTKTRYDELKKEKEYKVSHILLPSEEKAIEFIAKIKKGNSFRRIAKKHSLDQDSSKRGGNIGWVNRHGIAPQIYIAAAELKNKEIASAPVKSNYGWHIVRRDGSRKKQLPPYSKHKQKILELVHRERIDTLIDHLLSKATVLQSDK